MMTGKQQLFDTHLVNEMIVAAIILYLTDKSITVDEDNVADFVLKNFPQIVASITNIDENGGIGA